MALRIVRNHNGQQEVISADLAADLGVVPHPDNYVADFRVTKEKVFVLVAEMNSITTWNAEGLVLFYRDLTPGAPWSRYPIEDSSFDPAYLSHQYMQVLITDEHRIFVLDAFSGEGGARYRARTIILNADSPWQEIQLSSNMDGLDVYLYFAGPNRTLPVFHGDKWLVGWDSATERVYDVFPPPKIPTGAGPQGNGFTLWTGVVAFAPDDIWAYQGDGAGGNLNDPETYLGHLIHWDGHRWDPDSRFQVCDARVDGFRCTTGDMAGRPGGGFIYLKDNPARLLPPGTDWVAIKRANVWTGEVEDYVAQSATTLEWAFRGLTENMRGTNPPGDYLSLGQGSWFNQWNPQGTMRAFADGGLLVPSMAQPPI